MVKNTHLWPQQWSHQSTSAYMGPYDDRHRNPNIDIREIIWLGNQLRKSWRPDPGEFPSL